MPTVQPFSATAPVKALAGTAAEPSITFTSDTDTGLYSPGANQVAIATGGVQRLLIGSDGSITPASPLRFPLGTASSPSISFTGDTNTGLYSPGADQVAISTGGSGRLFVDASGNVGVGSTPSSTGGRQLDVDGVSLNPAVLLRASSATSANTSWVLDSVNSQVSFVSSDWPIRYYINGSERLRITSAGLVGVGTSAPTDKLTVVGSSGAFTQAAFRINGTTGTVNDDSGLRLYANCNTGVTNWFIGANYSAANVLEITPSTVAGGGTYSTPALALTPAGRVGVGTTSPVAPLDVNGNISLSGNGTNPRYLALLSETSTYAGSYILQAGGGSAGFGGAITMYGHSHATYPGSVYIGTSAGSSGSIIFGTNNAIDPANEKVRITSAGLVGIGTSSPVEKLDVIGNYRGRGGTSSANTIFTELNFVNTDTTASPGVRIAAVTGGNTSRHELAFYTTSNNGTNTTEKVRIDHAGNVGIGTTGPVATLHSRADNAGSGSTPLLIQNRSISANTAVGISFAPNTSDTADRSAIIYGVNSSGGSGNATDLTFHTNANGTSPAEKARIDSSGRLLVGTSSSSAEAKFIVQGGSTAAGGAVNIQRNATTASAGSTIGFINFTNSANNVGATISADGDGTWSAGTSHPTKLVFSTTADGASSPTERMRIDSAGQIEAGSLGTAAAPVWTFLSDPNTGIYSPGADQVAISTNGTGRLFVDSSGNVGVGVAPSAPFDVYGVNNSLCFRIDGGAGVSDRALRISNYGNSLVWNIDSQGGSINSGELAFSTNSNERLRITSAGLVGVGTSSPAAELDVRGGANIGDSTSTVRITADGTNGYISTSTNHPLRIRTNNLNAITIDTSQRVGIGTTSPGELLSVNGNVSITSTNRIKTTDSGGNLTIQGGGTFPGGHIILNGGNGSDNIIFNRSGASASTVETARIDSSGRLLVGTSTHQGDNTLQIQGDAAGATAAGSIYLRRGLNTAAIGANVGADLGDIQFGANDGTIAARIECLSDAEWTSTSDCPGRLVFSTTADGAASPTERLRITSAGLVGVGTGSPSGNLDVRGLSGTTIIRAVGADTSGNADVEIFSTGTSGNSRLYFSDTAAQSGSIIYTHASNSLSLATNAATAVTIDSSQRVGIGTTSPSNVYRTTINGDGSSIVGGLSLRNNGTETLTIGNVTAANDVDAEIWNPRNGYLRFATNNTERLRITSAGLVGVGTSSPDALLTVNGVGAFGAGSATAPSVAFTGDLNTGIYSPGADQVAISTGGSERLAVGASGNITIPSGGNLGINGAAPQSPLDVISNSSGYGISMRGRSGDNLSQFRFASNNFAATYAALDSAPTYLAAQVNGSERLRITSAGLVGIGTSSPGYALDVVAGSSSAIAARFRGNVGANNNTQIRFYGNNAAADQWAIGGSIATSDTGRDFHIYDLVANANRFAINSSGNVGIGTTSPLSPLTVSNGSNKNIEFQPGSTCYLLAYDRTASDYLDLDITAENLIFSTNNGTERARITSAGLVGVGTSAPGTSFHVGAGGAFTVPRGGGSSFTPQAAITSATGVAGISVGVDGPGQNGRSALFLDDTNGVWGLSHTWGTTPRPFVLMHDTNERLRVDTAGRLGIGTSSPDSYKDEAEQLVVAKAGNCGITIASASNGVGALYFADGTSGSDASRGGLYYSHIDNSMQLLADGSARVHITSAGNVGIGTTSPSSPLTIESSAGNQVKITYPSIASYFLNATSGGDFAINKDGTERARIDSSGRLLVGTSSARSNLPFAFGNNAARLQVEGAAEGQGAFAVIQNYDSATTAVPAVFNLARSGATSVGSNTAIASGNQLGEMQFSGSDGTNFIRAASIRGEVDGTPGANDMPGRLVFSTTADGASSPTERLRITSAGLVGIGTSTPSYKLDVSGAAANAIVGAQVVNTDPSGYSNLILRNSGGTAKEYQLVVGGSSSASANNFWLYDATAGQVRLHVSSAGNVGIGTTSPGYKLDVAGTVNVVNGSNGRINLGATTNYLYGDSSGNLIAGNSGGDRVQIDSSGRLLVGTSSTSVAFTTALLQGSAGDTAAQSILRLARGSSTPSSGDALGVIAFSSSAHSDGANIYAARDGGTWSASSLPTALVFSTTADGASSPTERMRIDSAGVTKFTNGNGTFLELLNTGGYSGFHAVDGTAYTIGQNSNVRSLRIGSGSGWLTTGVELAHGGTSWGTYSDVRLKTDIVELTGCLDTIKDIRCVSYRLTDVDESDSKKRLGVIAQDLVGKYDEAVNASKRSDDDETEYLSVQYTDLVPVLIKALQEATFKIETLEAKVAVLETA